MKWLRALLTNRFIKSAVRYLLAGLITILAPIAFPGVPELVEFLQTNLEPIAGIITLLLSGLLAVWSVAKNKANKKIAHATK